MKKLSCMYATPCGWCSKWDKECDQKVGNGGPQTPVYRRFTLPPDPLTPGTLMQRYFANGVKNITATRKQNEK